VQRRLPYATGKRPDNKGETLASKWATPEEVAHYMGTNVFDHIWEQERIRLAGLEATLDPGTIRFPAPGDPRMRRLWEESLHRV
jgi:hypothetical protein